MHYKFTIIISRNKVAWLIKLIPTNLKAMPTMKNYPMTNYIFGNLKKNGEHSETILLHFIWIIKLN